jgi:hypothetical protein
MKVIANKPGLGAYLPIKLTLLIETEEELKVLRDLTWRHHADVRDVVVQVCEDTPHSKVYREVLAPIYHTLAEYNNDNGTE